MKTRYDANPPMRSPVALPVACLCLAAPMLFGAHATTRLDGAWKTYVNRTANYCVSYPGRWLHGEAYDGAGMWMEAGAKKYSLPQGEMDVAAVKEEPAVKTAEYLQAHLDGLRRFERAQRLEMLGTRNIELPGVAGLLSKARYFDPQDSSVWVDEVVLATHEDVLYRLELECRADQLQRFERMFTRMVESFRLNCNGR